MPVLYDFSVTYSYLFVSFQLIFRKVADVRREKELAERRKNEPQLDSNQDQLVRKIFSKFRCRDRGQLQTQYSVSEIEKGATDAKPSSTSKTENTGAELVPSSTNAITASAPALNNKISRPPGSSTKSRWGRFSSSGSMSDSVKSDSYLARPPFRDIAGSGTGGTGGSAKMFPKLQNVSAESGTPRGIQRQDTIEEGIESIVVRTSQSPSFSGLGSSGALGAGGVDDGSDPEMVEPNLKKSETPSLTRRLSQIQPSSSDFKEMQSALSDFKAETNKELQRIGRHIERLEDMIRELVTKIDVRHAPLVNAEQQTESQYMRPSIYMASDRESASTTTEAHQQIPPLSNIILRKRRSRTRMKATAPGIPYRSTPQRSRSLLKDVESTTQDTSSGPGQTPSSGLTSGTSSTTATVSASGATELRTDEKPPFREYL